VSKGVNDEYGRVLGKSWPGFLRFSPFIARPARCHDYNLGQHPPARSDDDKCGFRRIIRNLNHRKERIEDES